MRNIMRIFGAVVLILFLIKGLSIEIFSKADAASTKSIDWIYSMDNVEINGRSEKYLIELSDLSGKTRFTMQDILRSIDGPIDYKKYNAYNMFIEDISADGSKMVVIRDRKDAYSNEILVGKQHFIYQIYNLKTGKREAEFKREGQEGKDILFTPDYNHYLYKDGKHLHIVNVHTGLDYIQNNQNYISSIYDSNIMAGTFSVDGKQLVYTGKDKGIVVTDLSKKPYGKLLLSNLKGINMIYWYDTKEMLCDLSDNRLYLINMQNGKKNLVYKYPDEFTSVIPSPDKNKVLIQNRDFHEAKILDIQTGKKYDISKLFNKDKDWLLPVQWVSSTIDYSQYMKH